MEDYKYLFKIILVGDAGVGKTALVRRFTKGFFPFQEAPTIGVDVSVKTVTVNGERVKFRIWDSAGQERFKSLTTSYYRNADAAILVYSIDNEDSFNNTYCWTGELEKYGKQDLVKVIVGNKCDLEERRLVSQQTAIDFAMGEDFDAAMECSAKESDNVEELFRSLARKLISMNSSDIYSAPSYQKDSVMNYSGSRLSVEKLSLSDDDTTGSEIILKKERGLDLFKFSSNVLQKLCKTT